MNLTNYYWYFKSALTPRFCDEVIEYAKLKKELIGKTGSFGDKKLTEKDLNNLKLRRNSNIGWMKNGFIEKYIHLFTKQTKKLVGIFNGIIQNNVNLQNIKKINFMIGITILILNLTIYQKHTCMVRLENYL